MTYLHDIEIVPIFLSCHVLPSNGARCNGILDKPILTLDFPYTLLSIWNPLPSTNSLMPHATYPWCVSFSVKIFLTLIKLQSSRAYLTLLFPIRFSISTIVCFLFIFVFVGCLTLPKAHKGRVLSALSTALFLNPRKLVGVSSHSIYTRWVTKSILLQVLIPVNSWLYLKVSASFQFTTLPWVDLFLILSFCCIRDHLGPHMQ